MSFLLASTSRIIVESLWADEEKLYFFLLYKMSFDELPYELQFQYLLDLPYREILKYCSTSRRTHLICQTEDFWNQKSLKDFGIPNSIIPGPTPAQRYARLEQLSHKPQELILELVRLGYFQPLPSLFETVGTVKIIRRPGVVRLQFEPIVVESLIEAISFNHADMLNRLVILLIAPLVGTKFQGIIANLLRGPFIETITLKRPQLEKIIRQFYDPSTDDPASFVGYYEKAIADLDFDLLNYLGPMVEPLIEPYEVYFLAISTHNQQMIEYIEGRYPVLVTFPEDVNFMLSEFITEDDPVAIEILVRLAWPVIDFRVARNFALGEGKEHLLQYLDLGVLL